MPGWVLLRKEPMRWNAVWPGGRHHWPLCPCVHGMLSGMTGPTALLKKNLESQVELSPSSGGRRWPGAELDCRYVNTTWISALPQNHRIGRASI